MSTATAMAPLLTVVEAERHVAGALLLDAANAFPAAAAWLGEDATAFTDPVAASVYRVVHALLRDRLDVTPETVALYAGRLGLADVLTPTVGAALVDLIVDPGNVTTYARLVADAAQRRHVKRLLRQLTQAAEGEALSDPNQFLVQAVDALTNGGRGSHTVPDSQPLSALLWPAAESIDRRRHDPGGLRGAPTGLPRLDAITGGWRGGHLVVVGARPGVGKTSFAIHAARTAAMARHPVLVLTLEQPVAQLAERLLLAEVGETDTAGGLHPVADRAFAKDLVAAVGRATDWPVTLQGGTWTAAAVRLAVQRWLLAVRAVTPPWAAPPVVILDYLGLLVAADPQQRYDLAVGANAYALARMAVDLDIAVIALHQLSRRNVQAGTGSTVRRPQLADLRDSGVIEAAADLVIAIHEDGEIAGQRELLVLKHRHGPRGVVPVVFYAAIARFDERSSRERPPYFDA